MSEQRQLSRPNDDVYDVYSLSGMQSMDAPGQSGISPAQALAILRCYWKHSLIIVVSIMAAMFVVIKILPKTYSATATLMVNSDNKDPLAGQQFPVDVVGNYVATQVELITSPVVLLPVVDRLNLTQDRYFMPGKIGNGPSAVRELVEKTLASRVTVDRGPGGELLYVTASSRDSAQAAAIANTVGDVYMEEERKRVNDPAIERAQRYSAELAELRDKAAEAQEKVTAFRQSTGMVDVAAAATDSEMQGLTALEGSLVQAQTERRALEARQSGQVSAADEALSSHQISELKTRLSTMRSEMAQLTSTLGPRHPKVMELASQIESTQKGLDQEISTLSENNATQLMRARSLEDKLSRAAEDQRAKVLHLRQLQDEGEKLSLELESAQAVYKRALDGYDQIMFASVGGYTSVSFIARAPEPVRPSKPNKLKLMMASTFAALLLGIGAPLGYELLFNRRVRCRDDIERALGIPVLAEFDPIVDVPAPA